MGEALNVALTEMARSISHLLRSAAKLSLHQFRQPLQEKATIYQHSDASNSHTPPQKKSPKLSARSG